MSNRRVPGGLSRRVFLQRLTFFGGGVVLYACHDRDHPKPIARHDVLTSAHLSFTNPEFAALTAACERLLPRDQDPGATDAHVPQYIDRVLQDPELAQMRQDFVEGLEVLERRSRGLHQKGFAELTAAEQDALLTGFKDGAEGSGEAHFYELLITLTLEGFLGDPSYGGNKDRVGWALVGFDTTMPPAGYDGMAGMAGMHHGGAPKVGGAHGGGK